MHRSLQELDDDHGGQFAAEVVHTLEDHQGGVGHVLCRVTP